MTNLVNWVLGVLSIVTSGLLVWMIKGLVDLKREVLIMTERATQRSTDMANFKIDLNEHKHDMKETVRDFRTELREDFNKQFQMMRVEIAKIADTKEKRGSL